MSFEDFKAFIERFGFILALATTGSVVAFVAGANDLAPFWLPAIGFLSALTVIVALALTYQLGFGTTRKRKSALLLISAAAASLFIGGYALAYSQFVVPTDIASKADTVELTVLGCEWTHAAKVNGAALHREMGFDNSRECPGNYSALDEEGMPYREIWTPQSVALVKAAMIGLWFAGFFSLGTFFAAFASSFSPGRRSSGAGEAPPDPAPTETP
jgi:hypothetical protein